MMRSFLAAIQFLTVIPFPRSFNPGEVNLGRSVPYFPVVGLLIGVLAAILGQLMAAVLPPLPACAIVVIFLLAVSGGLHMDGLADTADGFFSARPRERVLEIMRDSHVGVMGVIAVVSIILLKFSLLASLPSAQYVNIIILMPLAGRCASVIMMTTLPYVRDKGGIASLFDKKRSRLHALWAVLFLVIAGSLTAQWMGFTAGIAALALTALFSVHSFRKIGGYTGDALGAACEMAEIIPALVAVIWNKALG
jgi:adenosylcobinamide-GDP ribazoletransferase